MRNLVLVLFCIVCFPAAADEIKLLAIHKNKNDAVWRADLTLNGDSIRGSIKVSLNGEMVSAKCTKTKIKSSGKFKMYCKSAGLNNRVMRGTIEQAKIQSNGGRAGSAVFRFLQGEKLTQFLEQLQRDPELTTDEF